MDKKESRRVKITKMILNESFLEFLSQKPLARITVKEICEASDVNRSTYYTHFTDPYDQLKKLEASIMADMTVYVDTIISEGLHDDKKQRTIIHGVLDYIQSKRSVFQVLLGKSGDLDLERDILTFFGERIFPQTQPKDTDLLKRAYEYMYTGMGTFGLIRHWIMDDHPVDIDTMTDWIATFNEPHKQR